MSDGKVDAPLYLCLDQGGHSSRALVVNARGDVVAAASNAVATRRDGDKVEHDPMELVDSLRMSATAALAQLGGEVKKVVAAGLATQRSSIACWRRDTGVPLSPVLSWQDTRAADWLAGYAAQWQRVHDATGLVLSPHYGVSKLRWCLDNLPAVAAAADRSNLCCGPLASFLAMQLTRSAASFADPANASRTLLWSRNQRDWADELLQLFGVPRDYLPPTVPSRYDWGDLDIAGQTIPVTVVTGDQSAALFAFGVPATDTTYINMGTGAFAQRALANASLDPGRLLASVVYQDANHATAVMEGTVNGAGSALTLVSGELQVGREQLHACSAEWLEQIRLPPLYLNAVAGLGSPWWRTDMASRFEIDADVDVSKAAKIAAVLESIVFLLTVNLRYMDKVLKPGKRIVATGGLASVDPLLQRLSDLSGVSVQRAEVREATAIGLAFLVAGLPQRWIEVTADRIFQPAVNPDLQQRFKTWQQLMPRIS